MVTPGEGGRPRQVVVVGAGMVGLSTAWFLQDHGIDVTVIERGDVAAGASWGNAGWLTPGLTAPLPDPAVLGQGLRALLDPSSPVVVPRIPSPRLLRFLSGFARHSTTRRWRAGMSAYLQVNAMALGAFDRLAEGGVSEPTHEADPFLACYRTPEDRRFLLEELEQMAGAGQDVRFDILTGEEARRCEPALSPTVGAGIRIHGQRYIHPPRFMDALAASFRARGGTILTGRTVTGLQDRGESVEVADDTGITHRVDAVVVASGAELGDLTRAFGVRHLVQAGRGYSFTVRARQLPSGPVYFPAQRLACTPLRSPTGDRLRVAGTMEFRSPSAPLDRERIDVMAAALAPLMDGLDLHERQEEWVGSRPCTTDGLPLVGGTRSRRVFVAGGHGMWGIVLGPVTGQLLASLVATGQLHPALTPFDPTR
ncbi:MAG: FAD-binding oxidoreductase [Dermatophilaceae bacterium]|nr:FAD-binding oxidoreductase [Dermatophilaceae bacterium]